MEVQQSPAASDAGRSRQEGRGGPRPFTLQRCAPLKGGTSGFPHLMTVRGDEALSLLHVGVRTGMRSAAHPPALANSLSSRQW